MAKKPFEDYVVSVKVNIFPRKIAELNQFLDSDEFSFTNQPKLLHEALNTPAPNAVADDSALDANEGCELDDEQSSSDQDEKFNKKRKRNNGEATAGCRGVPAILSGFEKYNEVMSKLIVIDIVKPYARESADDVNLLKMLKKTMQPFKDYVASVKVKSENLIKNIFPRRIAELNQFLDSDEFSFTNQQKLLHEAFNNPAPDAVADDSALDANDGCESDDGQSSSDEDEKVNRKRKRNNGEATTGCHGVPAILSGFEKCNGVISKLIDLVKPYACEAADDANLLKMCLTILIPKIEDGNNFGVEVQETILMETMAAEAVNFKQGIVQYHTSRVELLKKIAKNPQDSRKLVVELHEHQLTILRTALSEIRNHYAELYDLMTKNWEKIIKAQSSNAENLY